MFAPTHFEEFILLYKIKNANSVQTRSFLKLWVGEFVASHFLKRLQGRLIPYNFENLKLPPSPVKGFTETPQFRNWPGRWLAGLKTHYVQ